MYAVDLKYELLYEILNDLNYIDHTCRSNPFFWVFLKQDENVKLSLLSFLPIKNPPFLQQLLC